MKQQRGAKIGGDRGGGECIRIHLAKPTAHNQQLSSNKPGSINRGESIWYLGESVFGKSMPGNIAGSNLKVGNKN